MEAKSLILKYIKDYLLLIDKEAEIFQTDFYLDVDCDAVARATLTSDQYDGCKKIIAYYPLTEGVKELDLPLLPNPFEEEPLMKQASKLRELRGYHKDNHYSFCGGFIEGYKAAQSKQFSLEDMYRVAIAVANKVSRPEYGEIININEIVDTYIQSLFTQRLPKEFIPEYDLMNKGYNKPEDYPYQECKVLKTITNSKSKQELVGIYKY